MIELGKGIDGCPDLGADWGLNRIIGIPSYANFPTWCSRIDSLHAMQAPLPMPVAFWNICLSSSLAVETLSQVAITHLYLPDDRDVYAYRYHDRIVFAEGSICLEGIKPNA